MKMFGAYAPQKVEIDQRSITFAVTPEMEARAERAIRMRREQEEQKKKLLVE